MTRAVEIMRSALPETLPRVGAVALNLRVLGAAAGLSLLTALLFGMAPVVQASKPDLGTALKDGTPAAGAGAARQRLRDGLEAYVPMAQTAVRAGAELVIHTTGDPYAVLPAVRSAVFAVLPDVPVRNVRSMEDLVAARIAQRRLSMLMLGLFGMLGLVIAAVGIYGVRAYVVAQRTREIGIRMALGATRLNVMGRILGRASVLVGLGVTIGTVGAWYLGAVADAFLFGVEATDPRAFAAAVAVLYCSALLASIVPAGRATRVDPVVALRAE